MSVEYWFLLPVGISIAFLAMSSGISAGTFWVPVYLLWAQFDAPVAFWMTLATMLCGYGSGVVRNLRQGTIHRDFIVQYLPLTVPAAVVGAYLSPALNGCRVILLFGVFVCGYGARMLVQKWHQPATPQRLRAGLPWGIAISGGVLLGLITVGLGELMLPRMLADRKLGRAADAVGAAVLIIFVTSLAAALARLNGPFMAALVEQHTTLLRAMAFAAPGVILGGQLGPMIARRFNARSLQLYVAVLLLLVGALMLVRFLAMAGFMG
ncbi:MAG TPA: sulfite exporter TauE/SafE family protein [Candidatus Tectomicrobia bacterium]